MEDDMWSRMTLEDPWDTGELGRDEEFVKVVELSDEQEKVMNEYGADKVDWNNAPEDAQFFSAFCFRQHVNGDEYYWEDGIDNDWGLGDYESIEIHQRDYHDFQMRPVATKPSSEDYQRTLSVKESEVFSDYVIKPKQKTSIDFLEEVKAIQSQRAVEYEQDGGERSFYKVATVFNIYTGMELQPSHVALMLEILKNVRFYAQDGYHSDSVVDKISYASLWAELVTKERT